MNSIQAKLNTRVMVKKIQLGSARVALLDELVSLRNKLTWAIKHLEEDRSNTQVSSNLGYAVAEIVRKQEAVDGVVREIQTINDMIEESKAL